MGNLHCCDESIKGKTELPTLVEHKDKESPLVVSNKSIQPVSFQLEESSKEFCKNQQISEFYVPLLTRVMVYGHEAQFEKKWSILNESEKSSFLEDLNSIKFQFMDQLYDHFLKDELRQDSIKAKLKGSFSPNVVEYGGEYNKMEQYRKKGIKLIKKGKVALVLMCGGVSSRFGKGDKFLYPFQLDRKVNMLDITFENLRKITNQQHLPIIISCNRQNLEEIQSYIIGENNYGFEQSSFHYSCASSMVMLEKDKRYCLGEDFRLIKKPVGTAQNAELLFGSNIIKALKRQQVEYVYFSGMENMLEKPLDPLLIGQMIAQNRQMAAKCTSPRQGESQELPRFISYMQGDSRVNFLSVQQMQSMNEALYDKLPIAMNSFVISFPKLEEIVEQCQKDLTSPSLYSLIRRKQPIYDYVTNTVQQQQCYSFERDIRHYISLINDPLLIEVKRQEHYMPVITKAGDYSLTDTIEYLKMILGLVVESQPVRHNVR